MNTCRKTDLNGQWKLLLSKTEPEEHKILEGALHYNDQMTLPSTLSLEKKTPVTGERSTGYLTDPHAWKGYAVFSREISFTPNPSREVLLTLEKTRVSTLYMNGKRVGRQDSLCTPHIYNVTEYLKGNTQTVTLVIDNVTCPVPGGHMTSPDTQTDWLGITGDFCLQEVPAARVTDLQIYPDYKTKELLITGSLTGCKELPVTLAVSSISGDHTLKTEKLTLHGEASTSASGSVSSLLEATVFSYRLPLKDAQLWSEHHPACYVLKLDYDGYEQSFPFGMRQFSAKDYSLYVNDTRIFLRGKHDGMLFPLTGVAPTDLDSWLKVMGTAKEHGINHYRFHTCCPPEAAFQAADQLGIYLSPELPFWGTVEEEITPAQAYLIQEGFRILDTFGNHPSFFGFSLGNELWGSQKLLDRILADYRAHDNRHLYTQGSNNFQFVPAILEHEDYFVGVRFSKERLFRGSYAMCDAPLGRLQTEAPDSSYTYDEMIRPGSTLKAALSDSPSTDDNGTADNAAGKTMEIQYGTGVKTVTLTESHELIPQVPVISHEIGQYFMYPDYDEIEKYTGVLKPYNFEIFKERLQEAGLSGYAKDYFQASGHFAADCYKLELETALRSRELSGFQLLDLQDFTGQGTALVGLLNSFMESKGIVSSEEFREFCSSRVLLACLDSFVQKAGTELTIPIKFYTYTGQPEVQPAIQVCLYQGDTGIPVVSTILPSSLTVQDGVHDLGSVTLSLPQVTAPVQMKLTLALNGSPEVHNHYDLWIYPDMQNSAEHDKETANSVEEITVTHSLDEASALLQAGKKVLFFPKVSAPANPPEKGTSDRFVAGTYCTDFWNYPMFRSISESVNRAWPVGTLGILTDPAHPALQNFPSKAWSTPQWYDIVMDTPVAVLDGTGIRPIVRTMDNCERNHNLGLIYEVNAGNGKLLVCSADLTAKPDSLPCQHLLKSLLQYMSSRDFAPEETVSLEWLKALYQ